MLALKLVEASTHHNQANIHFWALYLYLIGLMLALDQSDLDNMVPEKTYHLKKGNKTMGQPESCCVRLYLSLPTTNIEVCWWCYRS